MTKLPLILATALVCVWMPPSDAVAADETATATLRNASGQPVGEVTFRQAPRGVLVSARLENLPAGTHGFHVHAVGACQPDFGAAGGHFNPDDRAHGFFASDGPHAGDFGNIHVPSTGSYSFDVFTTRLRLDEKLFDADGAAVVIHAGADDYRTDPAGAAGARIACGVITR